jgi:predicted transposase/invertase (TIGR01784 family)
MGVEALTRQNLYPYWDVPKNERQLLAEMEQGRVNRLFDVVFKFVMCKDESSSLFLDMANAFVFPNGEREFKKVRFIDREFSPDRMNGKGCRLDAFAVMDEDEKINLEVQFASSRDFLRRVLFYWSSIHSGQLSEGNKYSKIVRTVSVNLLGYEQFRDKRNFRSSFSVRDDESYEKLNDDMLLIFLEIPKFARMTEAPRNKQESWLAYFSGLGGEEMEKIAEREPMIAEALDREKLFLMDRDKRYAYILGWKYMMEESIREQQWKEDAEEAKEQLEQTKEQFKETKEQLSETKEQLSETKEQLVETKERLVETKERLEQTRKEVEVTERKKALEMAQKLLMRGVQADIISESSGLSLEEIHKLME